MHERIGLRPLEKGAGRLAAQGEVQSPVPSLTESVGYPGLIRMDLWRQGSLGGVGQFGGWEALVELNLNED